MMEDQICCSVGTSGTVTILTETTLLNKMKSTEQNYNSLTRRFD